MGPTDGSTDTPVIRAYKSWADTQLEQIRAQVPQNWHTWYVDHHHSGQTWHGMPPGGNQSAITTDTPSELVTAIRDPSGWLDDEITRIRTLRDAQPRHWTRERDTLNSQLDALLSLRGQDPLA